MSFELVVQRLYPEQIPENIALSANVGWPDDASDWRVLHAAGFVLGVRRAGELIGQGVLGGYAPHAATIAKMVVAPGAQRQGIGATILDGLLAEAERRSLTTIGLVATALGRPLYESRGFELTGEVAVFVGTPVSAATREVSESIADVDTVIAYERRCISCSRSTLLRERYREASVSALCRESDGRMSGFALAETKAPYTLVGPVIADTEQQARALTRAIFSSITGPVRIDVPAQQDGFRTWLACLGLPELGLRPEMARGGALPWQVPERFALATQAWG
jgi:GNAT superfamily N-acetyltransferase